MTANTLVNDIVYGQVSIKNKKAVLAQILFTALALIIPSITHRLGFNYLTAQPMHWMILFAGLTYGSVSGLILGVSVPVLSFLITGMPIPMMLPLMIPELAIYGFLTGLLKEKVSAFGSLAIALITGRIVFALLLIVTGGLAVPVLQYAQTTWTPGLVAVILQIALLPILSGLYIKWIKD